MKYNRLGRTGLLVSELCMGTMTFGESEGMWSVMGGLQQEAVNGLVRQALDAGINFIDTANVYAEGRSEEVTGKALKDLTENHGVILHDTPEDYFSEYMTAAKAALETNAAENEFFAEVWQSQKDFAEIAVPFWAGAQTSNANLGRAYADSLK